MVRHPLAALPDHLEEVSTALSEFFFSRHGNQAGAVLARAGVLPAELVQQFQAQNMPTEQALDRACALAVYNDCLTLIALACLNAGPVVDWGRLEGARL